MRITNVAEREWEPGGFNTATSKVTLFDGRGKLGADPDMGRTLLTTWPPGTVADKSQVSELPWDIYVVDGSITINGTTVEREGHCLIDAREEARMNSKEGGTFLIFWRASHWWV